MAAPNDSWLGLGDIGRVGWACLLFAFVLSAGLQIGHWSSLPSIETLRQSAKAQPADDEIYTGSILFVPSRGDDCWQRELDNLNDRLVDVGKVSCDTAFAQQQAGRRGEPSPRLDAIRKGFRGD